MAPARCSCSCRRSPAMRCRAGRSTCHWHGHEHRGAVPRGPRPGRVTTRWRRYREAFALPTGREGQAAGLPLRTFAGPRAAQCARPGGAGAGPLGTARACAATTKGRRPWIDYAELLRPGLARLAGASPDEVVAMNALTVNLHLLMASFYPPGGPPSLHRHRVRRVSFRPACGREPARCGTASIRRRR